MLVHTPVLAHLACGGSDAMIIRKSSSPDTLYLDLSACTCLTSLCVGVWVCVCCMSVYMCAEVQRENMYHVGNTMYTVASFQRSYFSLCRVTVA